MTTSRLDHSRMSFLGAGDVTLVDLAQDDELTRSIDLLKRVAVQKREKSKSARVGHVRVRIIPKKTPVSVD